MFNLGPVIYDEIELDKKVGGIWGYNIQNEKAVKLFELISERLPLALLDKAAKITGSDRLDQFSTIATMMYDRLQDALGTYDFFLTGDWAYKADKVVALVKQQPVEQ